MEDASINAGEPHKPQALSWARIVARSGVLPGGAAAAFAGLSLLALGGRLELWFFVVVSAIATASYAIDRIADEFSQPGHGRIAASLVTLAGLLFAAGVCDAIAHHQPRVAAASFVFPFAVAAYCPRTTAALGLRSIKSLPFVKNAYTAAVWSLLVVLAALAAPSPHSGTVAVLIGYSFLKIFNSAAASDLKDIASDRQQGILTLPVWLGAARTRIVLQWLNAVTAMATVICVAANVLPQFILFAELHAIIVAIVLANMGNARRHWYTSDIINDGALMLLLPLAKVGQILLSTSR
jgi:4-hydroxybenzoate polyprenyltransferase